ncbi:Anti-sigma-K factor RskA [Rhodoferax sp. OV413]|uniref:anti-sigma factor n=1 Tax=Rhodoferax sp. OV413 TaxID=1855285 RepID=UPI000882AA59|nr:anti-sigma factor [Rhodoferax sp. OV413]SDO13194.1 Anti-sigma-K factor RskA [Rhodoferax sp. OV413]
MSAPQDTQDLAAEYVLGTLSATRRHEVEQRLAHDAELRASVQAWEERLLPLTALAEPVEPSVQLWQRIERSVDHAMAPRRRPVPAVKTGWWNSLDLWRGLAGAGFAAAAIMASVLVTRQGVLPASPQYMVVLVAPQDKAPGWVIQASNPQQLSLIPLGQAEVPAEKSLQFWTKADGWNGPVSLGLVKPGQTLQIALDKLPPLQPNQLFELTLEPINGSPTHKPTGPIQFIGRAVKVL